MMEPKGLRSGNPIFSALEIEFLQLHLLLEGSHFTMSLGLKPVSRSKLLFHYRDSFSLDHPRCKLLLGFGNLSLCSRQKVHLALDKPILFQKIGYHILIAASQLVLSVNQVSLKIRVHYIKFLHLLLQQHDPEIIPAKQLKSLKQGE